MRAIMAIITAAMTAITITATIHPPPPPLFASADVVCAAVVCFAVVTCGVRGLVVCSGVVCADVPSGTVVLSSVAEGLCVPVPSVAPPISVSGIFVVILSVVTADTDAAFILISAPVKQSTAISVVRSIAILLLRFIPFVIGTSIKI